MGNVTVILLYPAGFSSEYVVARPKHRNQRRRHAVHTAVRRTLTALACGFGCVLGAATMLPPSSNVEAHEVSPVMEISPWSHTQLRVAPLLDVATDLPRLWPTPLHDELQSSLDRAEVLLSHPNRIKRVALEDLELVLARFGLNVAYPISPEHEAGSGVGIRENPVSGEIHRHHGVDIGCRRGDPIYAAADGTVRYSIYSREAGHYVHLDHGEVQGVDIQTRYLHMTHRRVNRGDTVTAGQLLGTCGNTGWSTHPHLHFETLLDQKPVSPFKVADFEALHTAWAQASIAHPTSADLPGWVSLNVAGEVTGAGARPERLAHEVALYEPWDGVSEIKVVVAPRDSTQSLHERRQAWAEFAHQHRTAVAVVEIAPSAWAAPPPSADPAASEELWVRHLGHLRFVGEVLVPWLDEAYHVRDVHPAPGSPMTIELFTSTYAHLPACSGDQPSTNCVAMAPSTDIQDAG